MPFVQPTSGAADGTRVGTTGLIGTLAPVIASSGMTRLGADIIAYPPFGVIGTTVSAGFEAGLPPPGTSMLTVLVAGVTTRCRGLACAIGGYSQAQAELSITISEWTLGLPPSPRRPEGRPGQLLRSIAFTPTMIFNAVGAILTFNGPILDGTPFSALAGMPITAGRVYQCMITVAQSATCEGVSGLAIAISNVAFDFPPAFFSFV